MVGILSDPGDRQRLVGIPSGGAWIAKVSRAPAGAEALDREYATIRRFSELGIHGLPAVRAPSDGVLLVEKIDGVHPRWDDLRILDWIANDFRCTTGEYAGIAPAHRDLTPWNVLLAGERICVIDWEGAATDIGYPPLMNLLDFVFRGAAMKRVRRRRVHELLMQLVHRRIAGGNELKAAVDEYPAYRSSVGAHGSPDDLLERSLRYLT